MISVIKSSGLRLHHIYYHFARRRCFLSRRCRPPKVQCLPRWLSDEYKRPYYIFNPRSKYTFYEPPSEDLSLHLRRPALELRRHQRTANLIPRKIIKFHEEGKTLDFISLTHAYYEKETRGDKNNLEDE